MSLPQSDIVESLVASFWDLKLPSSIFSSHEELNELVRRVYAENDANPTRTSYSFDRYELFAVMALGAHHDSSVSVETGDMYFANMQTDLNEGQSEAAATAADGTTAAAASGKMLENPQAIIERALRLLGGVRVLRHLVLAAIYQILRQNKINAWQYVALGIAIAKIHGIGQWDDDCKYLNIGSLKSDLSKRRGIWAALVSLESWIGPLIGRQPHTSVNISHTLNDRQVVFHITETTEFYEKRLIVCALDMRIFRIQQLAFRKHYAAQFNKSFNNVYPGMQQTFAGDNSMSKGYAEECSQALEALHLDAVVTTGSKSVPPTSYAGLDYAGFSGKRKVGIQKPDWGKHSSSDSSIPGDLAAFLRRVV